MSDRLDFIARMAMQYLDITIVPIVISAARLVSEAGAEEFRDLN